MHITSYKNFFLTLLEISSLKDFIDFEVATPVLLPLVLSLSETLLLSVFDVDVDTSHPCLKRYSCIHIIDSPFLTVVTDILAGFANEGFDVDDEGPLLFCVFRDLAFLDPAFLKKLLVEGDILGELEDVLLPAEEVYLEYFKN